MLRRVGGGLTVLVVLLLLLLALLLRPLLLQLVLHHGLHPSVLEHHLDLAQLVEHVLLQRLEMRRQWATSSKLMRLGIALLLRSFRRRLVVRLGRSRPCSCVCPRAAEKIGVQLLLAVRRA